MTDTTDAAPAGLERLACRFCQHTSLLLYGLADGGVTVLCDDCHAQGPRADTDAEAIAAWNTRAPAEPTEEMVEQVARYVTLLAGHEPGRWVLYAPNIRALLAGRQP